LAGGVARAARVVYEEGIPMMTLGALTLASALTAAPVKIGTRVGDAYPVDLLPSMTDGAPLSVARYRGRRVMLHQFASW
jgi:hypothetical protein